MSPVLRKKNPRHHMDTLENLFQDRLSSLGIRNIFAKQGWKNHFISPHIKLCRRLDNTPHREDAIIILTPGAQEKLMALTDPLREEYLARLIFCRTALLVFSQSIALPAPLKKLLESYPLPVAASEFHESLLESRLKAIIREKIKKCVTVHGVALEIEGGGILITGASGIGKTTTAIEAARDGYIWIADDVAVLNRQNSILFISGHRKIKDYLYTGQTGIVAVDQLLKPSEMKSRTVLTAIIDVTRTDTEEVYFELVDQDILETRMSCLRMRIPRAGYLDKNLLKKAVQKLKGSDH